MELQNKENKLDLPDRPLTAQATAETTALARFAKNLDRASEERVEKLARQDKWIVTDGDGKEHTFHYHPLTMKQWRHLQDLENQILTVMQGYVDQVRDADKRGDQLAFSGIVAQGRTAITAKRIEVDAISASYYLGIPYTGAETDPFYNFRHREMLEILLACRVRTEHGDPNA